MKSKKKDKKTVFVVEDEPDILTLIAINLQKSGFDVEKFGEAGPMLKTLEKRVPDLLILDLMLPDQDGLDVCKSLKKSDAYSEIPIIMVTAKTDEFDVVLGLELGADDYIPKPFSPRELVARVKAVLRRNAPHKHPVKEFAAFIRAILRSGQVPVPQVGWNRIGIIHCQACGAVA